MQEKAASSTQFSQIQAENEQLEIQKQALMKHAHVLREQNGHLNNELDRFVMTDEKIRAQLDRKGRVKELHEQYDSQI